MSKEPQVDLQQFIEHVRSTFSYCAETGRLHWRNPGPHGPAGKVAGRRNAQGYVTIKFGGGRYISHRLVWLYHHGEWPTPYTDHINCNRADDRIENLRVATPSQNARNRPRKPGGRHARGTAPCGNKWIARIAVDGKEIFLGMFHTESEASEAYQAAIPKFHGDFAYAEARNK